MQLTRKTLSITSLLLISACAVGPDYQRPAMTIPGAFKEAPTPQTPQDYTYTDEDIDQEPLIPDSVEAAAPTPPLDTTPALETSAVPETAKEMEKAQPKDDVARGQWWEVFGDNDLNGLEIQVAAHNQTVQAAEASFRQARALVGEARAAFFPTIGADASMSRGKAAQSTTSKVRNNYSGSLDASWVPDFWGRVRREMESSEAIAQASAADLALATLTAQNELAVDYLDLRIADEQKRLLDRTIIAYSKSLEITQNQYNSGIAVSSDVLQAKVQLENAQAQMVDIGVARAQFEHAIAVLVGKTPEEFSIAAIDAVPGLPDIPSGVPSQLLERRPDIAAAERNVISANAQIGVAEAAYFPDITLSAAGGYQSSALSKWFTLPSRFWSIGPSLVETLFDAGLRSAQTEAAIATYDQTVANYRQSVLTAFQEVEDNLAQLRIYAQEAEVLDSAVKDADKTVDIILNQYKSGTVSYLNVVTAQTASLNTQLSALNIRKQRLTAAATLIENLGGGWNVSELDKPGVTQGKATPLSFLPFF